MVQGRAGSLDQRLHTPDFFVDPYPVYRQLREQDPVHWSDAWNCWVLTRYRDVVATMHDRRLSNRRIPSYLEELPGKVRREVRPLVYHISSWLGFCDPPQHTRLRKLVSPAFTRRLTENMRPRIQKLVDTLIDSVAPAGQMDIVHDFAYPLPVTVICELIGIPARDQDRFKDWSEDVVAFLGTGRAQSGSTLHAQQSLLEMADYFRPLMARRRRSPREDLLSDLVRGEEGDQLDPQELLGMCVSLLIAGHQTTTHLLGNSVLALLRNPEQLETLRKQPSLIVGAVEELLRYDGPVQRNWRLATEDLEIRHRRIKKGQLILQMLGAANRDPAEFTNPDPDRLEITRHPNRHVAFGYGMHYCLGAPLARLEGQIAIDTLIRRLPDLSLQDENLEWHKNMAFRSLRSLPVVF